MRGLQFWNSVFGDLQDHCGLTHSLAFAAAMFRRLAKDYELAMLRPPAHQRSRETVPIFSINFPFEIFQPRQRLADSRQWPIRGLPTNRQLELRDR
jgi:hypothetical protein